MRGEGALTLIASLSSEERKGGTFKALSVGFILPSFELGVFPLASMGAERLSIEPF